MLLYLVYRRQIKFDVIYYYYFTYGYLGGRVNSLSYSGH